MTNIVDYHSVDTENTALLTVGEDEGYSLDEEDENVLGESSVRQDSETSSSLSSSSTLRYDYRDYLPQNERRCLPFVRWCIVGGASYAPQTDQVLHKNLTGLARCLVLLRQYQMHYGMPYRGGPRDQELVLRQVYTGLFAGGAPIWAISACMEKVVQGLTGHANVTWMMLPRMAFAQNATTGATYAFAATRKFDFARLENLEGLVVRLCSFATNTRGANTVPARMPLAQELAKAAKEGSKKGNFVVDASKVKTKPQAGNPDEEAGAPSTTTVPQEQTKMAKEILKLSSRHESLFYFANLQEESTNVEGKLSPNVTFSAEPPRTELNTRQRWARVLVSNDGFWKVTDNDRELFCRLATVDAMQRLDRIQKETKNLYPGWLWMIFRGLSSAGAAAFWFKGSWLDMALAFLMALIVAYIETTKAVSRQEIVVVQILASFVVGLTAGLIALEFPGQTCFVAIALGGVLNILQGFRIVFAVVEIMSRHTVAGSADLLEGMLFTGLIAYFLRFGQYVATALVQDPNDTKFEQCQHGVSEWWYFLFVPIAALSWSGLFNPHYRDLGIMCFHGTLAVGINRALSMVNTNPNINNFVASLVVSFCASVFSRFTGRQAVGSTVAAIYALVPGAYAVRSILSTQTVDASFFAEIVQRSVIIGLGAWSGSVLCSPAVVGTTRGLINQRKSQVPGGQGVDEENGGTSILFF